MQNYLVRPPTPPHAPAGDGVGAVEAGSNRSPSTTATDHSSGSLHRRSAGRAVTCHKVGALNGLCLLSVRCAARTCSHSSGVSGPAGGASLPSPSPGGGL